MSQPLADNAIKQLFTEARTHHRWMSKPIDENILHTLYETAKWGPTAINCAPMRVMWLTSRDAKERLCPALTGQFLSVNATGRVNLARCLSTRES